MSDQDAPRLVDDPPRRFVVLEHRWEGVHWDFLVEDGPGLRTWAVDAPIVAGVDLPARGLAAHRRIYLEYEGPISGDRGTVRRWDAGLAWVEVWSEGAVRLRVAGGQLVGVVDLVRDEVGAAEADGPRAWRFRLGKLS